MHLTRSKYKYIKGGHQFLSIDSESLYTRKFKCASFKLNQTSQMMMKIILRVYEISSLEFVSNF